MELEVLLHTGDTQFDMDKAVGGAWVTRDGKFLYVPYYSAHSKVLRESRRWGQGGYEAAFTRGWLRLSWEPGSNVVAITFSKDVALDALRSAMKAIKIAQVQYTYGTLERDIYKDGYWHSSDIRLRDWGEIDRYLNDLIRTKTKRRIAAKNGWKRTLARKFAPVRLSVPAEVHATA